MDVYARRKVLESNMATLQRKVAQLKRKDVLLIARQKHLRLRFLKVMAADTIPDSRQTSPTYVEDEISKAYVSHETDHTSSSSNSVLNNPSTKCHNVTRNPRKPDLKPKSFSGYRDLTDKSSRYRDSTNLSQGYTDVTDKPSPRYSHAIPERSSYYSQVPDTSPQEYTTMERCKDGTGCSKMFSNEASWNNNIRGSRNRGQDARALQLKKYSSTPSLNHMSHRGNSPHRPEPRAPQDLQSSHCLHNRQYHSMDDSYRYPARSREIADIVPNATSASYDSASSDSNYGPCPERDGGDGQEYRHDVLSRRSSGYESDVTSINGDDLAVPTLRRAVSVACVQERQPILSVLLSDHVKSSWC